MSYFQPVIVSEFMQRQVITRTDEVSANLTYVGTTPLSGKQLDPTTESRYIYRIQKTGNETKMEFPLDADGRRIQTPLQWSQRATYTYG